MLAPLPVLPRHQSHVVKASSSASSPALVSKYPVPLQVRPGLVRATSTRQRGAIGHQRWRPRVSRLKGPAVIASGMTRTVPRIFDGIGMHVSLISIDSAEPSHDSELAPISRWAVS